jgi:two-component sensor histidine kinase
MLIEIPKIDGAQGEFDAAGEANHRIANHLAILASMVRMHSDRLRKLDRPIDRAEITGILGNLGAKLETVAKLHRELARPQHDGRVELAQYLRDVITTSVGLLSPPGAAHVALALDIEASCHLSARDALRIALIACEVITNSIKYAHPAGVSGHLRVICRREGADLVLVIEDDGVGLPADVDPQTNGHVGFRVIRALASDLDAAINFASDDLGVTFTMRVPMEAPTVAADGQVLRTAGAAVSVAQP